MVPRRVTTKVSEINNWYSHLGPITKFIAGIITFSFVCGGTFFAMSNQIRKLADEAPVVHRALHDRIDKVQAIATENRSLYRGLEADRTAYGKLQAERHGNLIGKFDALGESIGGFKADVALDLGKMQQQMARVEDKIDSHKDWHLNQPGE